MSKWWPVHLELWSGEKSTYFCTFDLASLTLRRPTLDDGNTLHILL